jgi:hypothetical protein
VAANFPFDGALGGETRPQPHFDARRFAVGLFTEHTSLNSPVPRSNPPKPGALGLIKESRSSRVVIVEALNNLISAGVVRERI